MFGACCLRSWLDLHSPKGPKSTIYDCLIIIIIIIIIIIVVVVVVVIIIIKQYSASHILKQTCLIKKRYPVFTHHPIFVNIAFAGAPPLRSDIYNIPRLSLSRRRIMVPRCLPDARLFRCMYCCVAADLVDVSRRRHQKHGRRSIRRMNAADGRRRSCCSRLPAISASPIKHHPRVRPSVRTSVRP